MPVYHSTGITSYLQGLTSMFNLIYSVLKIHQYDAIETQG